MNLSRGLKVGKGKKKEGFNEFLKLTLWSHYVFIWEERCLCLIFSLKGLEADLLLLDKIYNRTVSFRAAMIIEWWAVVQTILMGVDCRGSVGIYAPLEYALERPTAAQRYQLTQSLAVCRFVGLPALKTWHSTRTYARTYKFAQLTCTTINALTCKECSPLLIEGRTCLHSHF